ncbi:unnamed protein product [Thelazia callipaeda]|uniref:Secreted protein n=1 Tax=Thelazia callipaeda TaxID=103827 RepID=A0A0N5CR11_THECL|nr:unnamed protein product [Thelazia callipaeda]
MATNDALTALPYFLSLQLLLYTFTPAAYAIILSYETRPREMVVSSFFHYLKTPFENYQPNVQTKRSGEMWMSLLTSALLPETGNRGDDHRYHGLRGRK